MTAEPTYEYRIIDRHGQFFSERPTMRGLPQRARSWDKSCPDDAPHRIQRRLITPWEDVPDDE